MRGAGPAAADRRSKPSKRRNNPPSEVSGLVLERRGCRAMTTDPELNTMDERSFAAAASQKKSGRYRIQNGASLEGRIRREI
jgi:hypothetical protein